MIHVVTAANRHLYAAGLESLFALRAEGLEGEAALAPGGRQADAYDNDDAVYLLALEGERVVGGHRLSPTLKPTMLGDLFPQLAAVRGVPEDAGVWEWSRRFVARDRRDGRLDLAFMTAVQELGLEEGLTALSAVVETWWLPRFQDVGFAVRPLGLPAFVQGRWRMAALITVRGQSLDCVKEQAGIYGSVLVRRGPQRPLVNDKDVSERRIMGATI